MQEKSVFGIIYRNVDGTTAEEVRIEEEEEDVIRKIYDDLNAKGFDEVLDPDKSLEEIAENKRSEIQK